MLATHNSEKFHHCTNQRSLNIFGLLFPKRWRRCCPDHNKPNKASQVNNETDIRPRPQLGEVACVIYLLYHIDAGHLYHGLYHGLYPVSPLFVQSSGPVSGAGTVTSVPAPHHGHCPPARTRPHSRAVRCRLSNSAHFTTPRKNICYLF